MNKNEIAQAVVEIPKSKGVFTILGDKDKNYYAISPHRSENNFKTEVALLADSIVLDEGNFYNSKFEFPGGKVEEKEGESIFTSAKKEILEELLDHLETTENFDSNYFEQLFAYVNFRDFEKIDDFLVLQTLLKEGKQTIRGIFEITAFFAILSDQQLSYLLAHNVVEKVSLKDDSSDFRPYQRAIIKKNLARI